jgi:HPr kinase/phosphorylase
MALMGFTQNFLPGRLQVIGESELAYLATLSPEGQLTAFQRVIELDAPACFVTKGLPVADNLLAFARRHRFPLFRSSLDVVEFIGELSRYLAHKFAPRTELHGTLVDVYGVGLMFTGRSGIGKSECALDLVERGHRLVADDVVEVSKTDEEVLLGRFRSILKHNIEIRGVGVIDVQAIFGIRAIRMQKRIEVEVQLQEWDDEEDYERLGLERKLTTILGVKVPQVIVPLVPGKNITVIAEVIALDFMLKVYGYDAAQILNDRILRSMHSSDQLRRYLQQDRE